MSQITNCASVDYMNKLGDLTRQTVVGLINLDRTGKAQNLPT